MYIREIWLEQGFHILIQLDFPVKQLLELRPRSDLRFGGPMLLHAIRHTGVVVR